MSKISKKLWGVCLLIIGAVLLFSCAKKTTGPSLPGSVDDLYASIGKCDWEVVIWNGVFSQEYTSEIGVRYISTTTLNESPSIYISVNGVNCTLVEAYWDEMYFEFIDQFTPGQSYNIILTVNGISYSSSLEIPYPVTIVYAPESFDYAQAQLFRWEIYKNASYQMLYYDDDDDGTNNPFYFYDFGEKLISSSVRDYWIPAYTSSDNYFSFEVFAMNIKINDKILYYASGLGDWRSFHPYTNPLRARKNDS